jgi:hypothetical protein
MTQQPVSQKQRHQTAVQHRVEVAGPHNPDDMHHSQNIDCVYQPMQALPVPAQLALRSIE